MRDLAGFRSPLLEVGEFLRDLAEGFLENRDLMLEAKPKLGVLVESFLAGFVGVRGFQCEGFVAVFLGELDAAIPIAVFHVRATEDHEAAFEFLLVDHRGHGRPCFLSRFCPGKLRK
jgi:hypothetical protein